MPKRAFCSKGRANDNTTASEWNDEMITGDCRLNFNLLSFLKNPPTRRHHYNPSSSILLSLCWDVTIKYLQPALNGLALFIQSYSPPTKPCLLFEIPNCQNFFSSIMGEISSFCGRYAHGITLIFPMCAFLVNWGLIARVPVLYVPYIKICVDFFFFFPLRQIFQYLPS